MLHGVRPEILALSEIPFVKAYTARLLYRAGLRCVFGAWGAAVRGRGSSALAGERCIYSLGHKSGLTFIAAGKTAHLRRTPEAVAAVENVDQIVSILADSKNP